MKLISMCASLSSRVQAARPLRWRTLSGFRLPAHFPAGRAELVHCFFSFVVCEVVVVPRCYLCRCDIDVKSALLFLFAVSSCHAASFGVVRIAPSAHLNPPAFNSPCEISLLLVLLVLSLKLSTRNRPRASSLFRSKHTLVAPLK